MAMTVAFTLILAAASVGWTDLRRHPAGSLETAGGVAVGSIVSSWLGGRSAEAGLAQTH